MATFGVDATAILSRLPQIDVGASAPITSARMTSIIASSGAEVTAVLDGYYGAGTGATIQSAGSGTTYDACAECVVVLALPNVYRAAHHGGDPAILEQLITDANDLRGRMRRTPETTFGYVPSSGQPLVATSTQGLDLDTTNTPAEAPMRSRYGGASYPATARGSVF